LPVFLWMRTRTYALIHLYTVTILSTASVAPRDSAGLTWPANFNPNVNSSAGIPVDLWRLVQYLPPLLPNAAVRIIVDGQYTSVWSSNLNENGLYYCWAYPSGAAPESPVVGATVFCRQSAPRAKRDSMPALGCDNYPCSFLDTDKRTEGNPEVNRATTTFVRMVCSRMVWEDFLGAGLVASGSNLQSIQWNVGKGGEACEAMVDTNQCVPTQPTVATNQACDSSTECFTRVGLPRLFSAETIQYQDPSTTKYFCCIERVASPPDEWQIPGTNRTVSREDMANKVVHTATCTGISSNHNRMSTCTAYSVRDKDNNIFKGIDRQYRCNYLCANSMGTTPNLVRHLCGDNDDVQNDCLPAATRDQCTTSMLLQPEVFCPHGGRPYRYKSLHVQTGFSDPPNIGTPGYIMDTYMYTTTARSAAVISEVRASCGANDFYCLPGYVCRCFGRRMSGTSSRICTNNQECSGQGTLWESENPATRPVCMCNEGYTGATCLVGIDTQNACAGSSQESTLLHDVFVDPDLGLT
jgi:hypothetical protein